MMKKIKAKIYLFILDKIRFDKDMNLTAKQKSQIDGLMYKAYVMDKPKNQKAKCETCAFRLNDRCMKHKIGNFYPNCESVINCSSYERNELNK